MIYFLRTGIHRKAKRYKRPSNPMPARKGLLAPQNTFLDTIATRFDGTRKFTFEIIYEICIIHSNHHVTRPI